MNDSWFEGLEEVDEGRKIEKLLIDVDSYRFVLLPLFRVVVAHTQLCPLYIRQKVFVISAVKANSFIFLKRLHFCFEISPFVRNSFSF